MESRFFYVNEQLLSRFSNFGVELGESAIDPSSIGFIFDRFLISFIVNFGFDEMPVSLRVFQIAKSAIQRLEDIRTIRT